MPRVYFALLFALLVAAQGIILTGYIMGYRLCSTQEQCSPYTEDIILTLFAILFCGLNGFGILLLIMFLNILKWEYCKVSSFVCQLMIITTIFFTLIENTLAPVSIGSFISINKFISLSLPAKFAFCGMWMTVAYFLLLWILFCFLVIRKTQKRTARFQPKPITNHQLLDDEQDLNPTDVIKKRTLYGMLFFIFCPCQQEEKDIPKTYPHCITTCPDQISSDDPDRFNNVLSWVGCLLSLGCFRGGEYLFWCLHITVWGSSFDISHDYEQIEWSSKVSSHNKHHFHTPKMLGIKEKHVIMMQLARRTF